MDQLDGVPCEVLGYHIKTRTQICLTCCISVVLELIVYLVAFAADVAVVVQHLRDGNPVFGGLTAAFVWLPAVVCFCSVVTSPAQWPQSVCDDDGNGVAPSDEVPVDGFECGAVQCRFFVRQLFNLLAFPVGAVYRWVIEFGCHGAYELVRRIEFCWFLNNISKLKLTHKLSRKVVYYIPSKKYNKFSQPTNSNHSTLNTIYNCQAKFFFPATRLAKLYINEHAAQSVASHLLVHRGNVTRTRFGRKESRHGQGSRHVALRVVSLFAGLSAGCPTDHAAVLHFASRGHFSQLRDE